MGSAMTVTGLFRQLVRNLWWIVVLAIIGATGMYFGVNHVSTDNQIGKYSASRAMYIGRSDYSKVDRSLGELLADQKLIKTYIAFGKDRVIIDETVRLMKLQGFTKITNQDVSNDVTLKQTPGTLLVRARANYVDEKATIALANNYAQAFANKGTLLIPGMPKPKLMVAIQGAALSEDYVAPLSPKKAAIYGAGAGLIIGVILMLFFGAIGNYRHLKRQ